LGKPKRSKRELDDLQEVRHENKRLKREIDQLRKQLQRIDFRRFENLSKLVDKQRKESIAEQKAKRLEKAKKQWLCHKCKEDYLRLLIYNPPVKGVMYYRQCGGCPNRTEMKPYNAAIEGITEQGELKERKDDSDAGDESKD
jgi:Zn finger protein HypA/HybF involved in hydrogenase expression